MNMSKKLTMSNGNINLVDINFNADILMFLNFLEKRPFHDSSEIMTATIKFTTEWIEFCDHLGMEHSDILSPFQIKNSKYFTPQKTPGLILAFLLASLGFTFNDLQSLRGKI